MTGSASRLPIETLPDADALAGRGAELIADAARTAVADRGEFLLAISGGHTPWPMFARLAEDPEMPWASTDLFQVDERVAPDDDPDRNWARASEVLPLDRLRSALPMPVTDDDLDDAAERYAELLPERFDLIHLGIGPDGHTASLVPGDRALDETRRRVTLTSGEYEGRVRMTLTFPVLNAARRILWQVAGEAARDPLARLLAGDEAIPAGRVARENALVIADRAAAP